MDRKKYLVVMAAGQGTRMGSSVPKQFMALEGKAILRRTMEKFIAAWPGLSIVTVLPSEHIDFWKDYCLRANFTYPQTIVCGGITRFHSVRNALAKVPDGAIVAIHDGVRPLVSSSLLRKMLEDFDTSSDSGPAAPHGAFRGLIPVVPSVDTLKVLEKSPSSFLTLAPDTLPPREKVFGAQTPQIFHSEDIKAAYTQAYDRSFTDDASVASAYEIPLAFCNGERYNIKITTPEDIMLAEALLKAGLVL